MRNSGSECTVTIHDLRASENLVSFQPGWDLYCAFQTEMRALCPVFTMTLCVPPSPEPPHDVAHPGAVMEVGAAHGKDGIDFVMDPETGVMTAIR